MARARRTSAILETARQRPGLKSIRPKPNLGPNLTPDSFEESMTGFIARPDTYSQHVADLDQEQNELEAAEVGLRDQNRRILSAVEAQFGPRQRKRKIRRHAAERAQAWCKQNTGRGLFACAGSPPLSDAHHTRHLPVSNGRPRIDFHRPGESLGHSMVHIFGGLEMYHYNKQVYFLAVAAVIFILANYPTTNAQNSFPTPTGVVNIADRDGNGCCAQLQLVVNDQQTHLYEYGNGYGSGSFQIHKYGSGSANGAVFTIVKQGNVGIGTTNPLSKLHIMSSNTTTQAVIGTSDGGGASGSFLYMWSGWSGGTPNYPAMVWSSGTDLRFGSGSTDFNGSGFSEKLRITSSGNVGIGMTNPGVALDVAQNKAIRVGNANISSGGDYVHISNHAWYAGASGWQSDGNVGGLYQIAGQTHTWYKHNGSGSFTNLMSLSDSGSLTVSGSVNAKYQDVAEWVPSSEKLAAGTVVVLDSTKSNQVVASTSAYDTRVAGVISAQPGITLGEKTDDKVLVATTGRVRVMVDATKAPINIGDLLVTSDIPGVAMKSEPIFIQGRKIHAPGTIIGKALEPLTKGNGEILVLLSLQ